MALPGVRFNVIDGNLGLIESVADKPLVVGPAISGQPNTIQTFSQPSAIVSALTAGQACTCAAHIVDVANGSVDVLLTSASVPGVLSAVTQVGTGPTVTVAIAQHDALKVFQIDDPAGTPVYVDETADFASVAATDVDPFPAADAVGDQFVIGFNAPFRQLTINVGTAGVGGVVTWKYWDGTAWQDLTGVTDGTTSFTVGGSNTVVWTMPTDWAARSINGSAQLFYVAAEISSGTYAPDPVLTQGKIDLHGPYDFGEAIVEIVAGGVLGTGTFRYSLDGGQTYGATRILPAGGTFTPAGSGTTITFAAGTYVAGTTYSFSMTPPTFNAADLDNAILAALAVNTRWKIPVFAGMSATASAAATIASSVIGYMDSLADDYRLNRALVHCGAEAAAAVNTAFVAVEDLRLATFHSTERLSVANPAEGWRKPLMPTHYNAAAMVAAFTRGTNIGWVGVGTVPNGGRKPRVTAITFDEFKLGEQLHDKKINTTRTLPGRATGFYFTNGLLKSPAGSDFRYLHWGLAFDLALETAIDALQPWVNANLRINPDGSKTMHPLDVARINKYVNERVTAAVMTPLNEQGFQGFLSAVEYKVDETYDILTNQKFRGDLRCVPLANTEENEVTAGLATALANEPEENAEEEAA